MKVRNIPVDQAKDAGLALTLVLLLLAHFRQQYGLIVPAIGILILTMTCPAVLRPLAHVWFVLSHRLGNIVSTILLTIIFVVIVTPVGLIRQIFGADSMTLKAWKKRQNSTFLKRDHLFSSEDLERPY